MDGTNRGTGTGELSVTQTEFIEAIRSTLVEQRGSVLTTREISDLIGRGLFYTRARLRVLLKQKKIVAVRTIRENIIGVDHPVWGWQWVGEGENDERSHAES